MTPNTTPRRAANSILAGASAAAIAWVAPNAASAQAQLDFWDMIWGPPEYIEAAESIVAKFNDEHPEIQVTYRSVPWSNWYQTFVTAISSGSAPDVSTGAGYQAAQLYDLGAIRPLDDLVETMRADGSLDDFAEGTVEVLRTDDHYVAIPWALDIRVWYFRKDLLDAAGVAVPTSLVEFREVAKAVTGDGTFGMVASGDTGGSHFIYASTLNNGGGLFDAKRNIEFAGNERNIEAIDWLAGLTADGSVHPASPGYSSDDRRAAFMRGEAAFTLEGPGLLSSDSDLAGTVQILPPMEGFHGDTGTIFWVNNIMMYEQTEHPEEAEIFLKWWSENSLALWTEGNCRQIPARQSFVEAAVAGDEYYGQIVETYLPIGKTTGTAYEGGIFPELSEIEGEGVMQTLTQQLFQGVEPGKAVAQADARLHEIMQD